MLEKAGYKFRVEISNVDESVYDDLDPQEHAKQLAFAKAEKIAKKFPGDLVLGADTVAACEGQIIGKPVDAADARRITSLLFSQPHKVITGVAFIRNSDQTRIVMADTTVIYPKIMSQQDLEEHILGGTWEGKAGAYAIQETGDRMIEKIEGSLTNVMGLPMELVTGELAKLKKTLKKI